MYRSFYHVIFTGTDEQTGGRVLLILGRRTISSDIYVIEAFQ